LKIKNVFPFPLVSIIMLVYKDQKTVVACFKSLFAQEMPAPYKLANLIIYFPTYDAFPVTLSETAVSVCPVTFCYLHAYQNSLADKYFNMVETNNVEALSTALIDFINGKSRINYTG